MAKLTAIILTYNKAHILEQFMKSLNAQERKPDELIVVDDCSTDGTKDILWKYCGKAQHIIACYKNAGQSNARNLGVEKARGQYIVFLDADLGMRADMFRKMEQALEQNPKASIAYCHYNRMGSRTDHVISEPWNADTLKHRNYISMISMVRAKDLPKPPFDPMLKRYEDWDLWIRMMKAGKTGVLVNEALFTAFYHPGDLSGIGESEDWYGIVRKKHGLG